MSVPTGPNAQAVGRPQIIATLVLIGATAAWGSTFFMIKDLMHQMPPQDYLGARFLLAGILITVFQFRRVKNAGRTEWRRGFALGAAYAVGQLLQTTGLQYTDASISGFVTGMYVVFTPLLVAAAFKSKLGMKIWSAVGLATTGLAFLSIQLEAGALSFGYGEALTLASAFFFAIHIVLQGQWAPKSDPLTLGSIQLIAAGVILGIVAIPGGIALPQSAGGWSAFIYLTVVAGLGAILAQAWAQARLSATTTAVVMTTEPLFAALFAVIFGGELLSARLLIGGTMVLIAMFLVEAPLPKLVKEARRAGRVEITQSL